MGGRTYTFEGVRPVRGPNYAAVEGRFRVMRDGRQIAELAPQSRRYPNPPMQTTEAAIQTGFEGDLYAVIGEPVGDGAWSTRLYFKPLVHWIWGGALIMVLGGALSLSDRRHRVGAPVRHRAPAMQAAE